MDHCLGTGKNFVFCISHAPAPPRGCFQRCYAMEVARPNRCNGLQPCGCACCRESLERRLSKGYVVHPYRHRGAVDESPRSMGEGSSKPNSSRLVANGSVQLPIPTHDFPLSRVQPSS